MIHTHIRKACQRPLNTKFKMVYKGESAMEVVAETVFNEVSRKTSGNMEIL